jgi:hypothetical protein
MAVESSVDLGTRIWSFSICILALGWFSIIAPLLLVERPFGE